MLDFYCIMHHAITIYPNSFFFKSTKFNLFVSLPPQVGLMQYCSTRGGVHGWDFHEVLFSGFAPDGGMFMPENVPVLSPNTLRTWKGLTYTQLVVEVASLFIPTRLIPRLDLEGELE